MIFSERFTPWQIIVSLITLMYAGKNLDSIVGLGCESNAMLYMRNTVDQKEMCSP